MHTWVSGLLGGLVAGVMAITFGQISQKRGGSEPTIPPRIIYDYDSLAIQTPIDEFPDSRRVDPGVLAKMKEGWEPVFWYESELKIVVKLGRDIRKRELHIIYRKPRLILSGGS